MATKKKIYWQSEAWYGYEPFVFPCDPDVWVTIDDIRHYANAMITASAIITSIHENNIRSRNMPFWDELRHLMGNEEYYKNGIRSNAQELLDLQEKLVLPRIEWEWELYRS